MQNQAEEKKMDKEMSEAVTYSESLSATRSQLIPVQTRTALEMARTNYQLDSKEKFLPTLRTFYSKS